MQQRTMTIATSTSSDPSLALAVGLGLLVAVLPAFADEKPDNAAALAGFDAVRTVFLVDGSDPKATARYLQGVRATHEQLAEAEVEPTTVLVFLGPGVQYITTERTHRLSQSTPRTSLRSLRPRRSSRHSACAWRCAEPRPGISGWTTRNCFPGCRPSETASSP